MRTAAAAPEREAPMPPRAYKIASVARRLELSRSSIYRLVASGELVAVKFASSFRVLHADLEDYLQRHRTARGPR